MLICARRKTYKESFVKKVIIAVLCIAVAAAAIVLARQAMIKTGKAYVLAEQLKTAGLPVEEIKVNENSAMYSEVSATGGGLNVKIGYYSNGLFMDKIVRNLEAGKTRETSVYEKPAILVSRLYILVVYAEPEKGSVKKMLTDKFGLVREY
jgi:hypothetical protein